MKLDLQLSTCSCIFHEICVLISRLPGEGGNNCKKYNFCLIRIIYKAYEDPIGSMCFCLSKTAETCLVTYVWCNFLVTFILFLHSDSDDESGGQVAPYLLMEKRNLEKSILLELEREHHLKVQVHTSHFCKTCMF